VNNWRRHHRHSRCGDVNTHEECLCSNLQQAQAVSTS
jgi:hypothetical protein